MVRFIKHRELAYSWHYTILYTFLLVWSISHAEEQCFPETYVTGDDILHCHGEPLLGDGSALSLLNRPSLF